MFRCGQLPKPRQTKSSTLPGYILFTHRTQTNWLLRATLPGPWHRAISPWLSYHAGTRPFRTFPHQGTHTLVGDASHKPPKGRFYSLFAVVGDRQLQQLRRSITPTLLWQRQMAWKRHTLRPTFLTPEPATGICYLGDIASIIRSKNARPYIRCNV